MSNKVCTYDMKQPKKVVIEVMFKAKYCLICNYMDEAMREVLPYYKNYIEYQRVDILQSSGKKRFLELSESLFGKEGVLKKMQLAPIPSMFINGELFFDTIPPRHLLKKVINHVIAKQFSEINDAKRCDNVF